MIVVVDASVVVTWYLPVGPAEPVVALLGSGHDLVGPESLHIEVASVLLRAVRRRELDASMVRQILDQTLPDDVRLIPVSGYRHLPFDIAHAHGGSVHDAVYISLARTLAAPIVTADVQMLRTALSAGLRAIMIGDGLAGLQDG